MSKKRIIQCSSFILALQLLTNFNVYAYTGAFSTDTNSILSSVFGNYWNADLINNPPNPNETSWISSVTGDEMHWQNEHQTEYYYDQLYDTTAPYIWGDSGYGLGSLHSVGSGAGLVSVAQQELALGVKEIPLGSNHTKYGDYLWGTGSSLPWCAAFISWCANQCGLIEDGTFIKTAGCRELYNYLHTNGAGEILTMDVLRQGGNISQIQPGDILFFVDGSSYAHVGIIETAGTDENGQNYITTIEGNSSDMVARRIYYASSTGSTAIKAKNGVIVRPNYPVVTTEEVN